MPAFKHTHKYRRVRLGKNKRYTVYRCVRPNCTHFIEEKLVLGRSTICWKCGAEFIMTEKTMKMKPNCPGGCKPLGHDEDIENLVRKIAGR